MIQQVVEAHRNSISASRGGRSGRLGSVRLDRALRADIGSALRSPPIIAFLGIEALAGAVFIDRRGGDTLSTVLLIYLAMLSLAFFAWWAGRHRLAHPQPDPLPAAGARSAFALMAASGMAVWGFAISVPAGFVLFVCGLGGWSWAAFRSGGVRGTWSRLTRDPRPFVPLLLLIGLPRLLAGGPLYLGGALLALPSGIGQQLLYLVGLFAPLEALRSRSSLAAVTAALVFALLHVPLNLAPNEGDMAAALANAVLFQASVGMIACLAFTRHRAVVPIGVAHALAIG